MAIERNLTGFESGDLGEQKYGGSAGWIGLTLQGTTPRSGAYRLQLQTATGTSCLVLMPAGSVTGTTGTVTSGNHKRCKARVYFRIDSVSFPFGNSMLRVFGLGGQLEAHGVSAWIDSQQQMAVVVGGSAPAVGGSGFTGTHTAPLVTGVWYRLILDVDYAVSANTTVTVSLQVTTDATPPPIDTTLTTSGNIGAIDTMGAVSMLSEAIRGGFDTFGVISFDDLVWEATSMADAASASTLPTETHITLVPIDGVALQQFETGTYTNCDEYPVSQAASFGDTMSSVLGSGTEVEFTHPSAVFLGLNEIQALKLFGNVAVSGAGTGLVDFKLAGVAKAVTVGTVYPATNGASNPNGGVLFSALSRAAFSAITFGLVKQNGTQNTMIGNMGLEVLSGTAVVTAGTQIRGNTQIKSGTIYDAQVADAAGIQRHKIAGLGATPVFFPDDDARDEWMIPGPPGSAASVRIPVVPVFLNGDGDGGGGGDMMVIPGPAGAAGAAGAAGSGGSGGGGGMVLLGSYVAASSASLDMTTRNATGQAGALFASDYDEYLVEIVNVLPATNSVGLQIRFGAGGSWASGASDYRWGHMAYGSGGPGNTNSTGASSISFVGFANASNSVLRPINGHFRVFDPRSTTAYKMLDGTLAFWDSTPTFVLGHTTGAYQAATVIDALQMFASSGNLASGTVRVYGIDRTGGSTSGQPATGRTLLAAQTASASATLDFATRTAGGDLFQTDYDEYEIEFINIVPATAGVQPFFRFTQDSGATYDSAGNYSATANYAFGSTTGASSTASGTSFGLRDTVTTIAANSSYNSSFKLFGPRETTIYKALLFNSMMWDSGIGPLVYQGCGFYKQTAAIQGFQFKCSSGNIASGSVRVYGVNKSVPAVSSGRTLLESHVASASATVDFITRNAGGQAGASLQSDYEEYDLNFIGVCAGTSGVTGSLQVSTDGGATWLTTGYRYTARYFGDAGDSGSAGNSAAGSNWLVTGTNATGLPGICGTLRITLSGGHCTVSGKVGFNHSNTNRYVFDLGMWQPAAVNAIRFLFSSGTVASGKMTLLGVPKG